MEIERVTLDKATTKEERVCKQKNTQVSIGLNDTSTITHLRASLLEYKKPLTIEG